MSLLSVSGLHAGYGGQNVLHGVDLRVEAGEIVTVVGPNGAGKSTLLKAIVGLVPCRTGFIQFKGADIVGRRAESLLTRGLALVPQTDNVFPSLTVREHMEIAYRGPRSGYHSAVADVVSLFPALTQRWRARAQTLSGGERQQLALARALVTGAQLLLLDELLAGLAPAVITATLGRIQQVNARGAAVVMVEHHARRALEISHRGYVLDAGRNALDGLSQALLKDPRMLRAYLGSARAPAVGSPDSP